MAERRSIDGNLAPNPSLNGTGSTTVNGWINTDAEKWAHLKTGTSTTQVAEFVTFGDQKCLHIVISSGNAGAITGFGTVPDYVGASITTASLPYLIKIEQGRSYTVSVDVWLVAGGTNIKANLDLRTYSAALARVKTTSSNTTTTGQWVTLTQTFTANLTTDFYFVPWFYIGQVAASSWSGEAYFSNPVFIDNTAGARTAATNRVAVRNMGTALRFDGVDDYVEVGTVGLPELAISQTQSFSMFFKWVNDSDWENLWTSSLSNNSRNGVSLRGTTTKVLAWGHYNGSSYVRQKGTNNAIQKNQWYHVAGSFDGTTLRLWLNGVEQSRTDTSPGLSGTNSFVIGADSDNVNKHFDGIIDEPRIWNRALTATEIQNLYLHDIVPTDGLVAEYLFDEASGSTALDTSGNGNNGTITGATYTTDTPLKTRTAATNRVAV
jgi:hypothetical protein